MDIILERITTQEGEKIIKDYRRLDDNNNDYPFEYVVFEIVRGMSMTCRRAINREFKVCRHLTISEAFNAGVKID